MISVRICFLHELFSVRFLLFLFSSLSWSECAKQNVGPGQKLDAFQKAGGKIIEDFKFVRHGGTVKFERFAVECDQHQSNAQGILSGNQQHGRRLPKGNSVLV